MKFRAVCFVLFCVQFSVHQAQTWSQTDSQTKTRHKFDSKSKPSYKSPSSVSDWKLSQTTEKNVDDDDSRSESEFGNEENVDSNELVSNQLKNSYQVESVRNTMDNIVKEMRSKTMNKVYQSIEAHEPIEQSTSNDESGDNDNIRIAVKSKRRYEFVPVHFDRENMKSPRMIEIVSDTMPLRLHFKSQSAAIVVTQSHMSPPMKPLEESVTMDEPYRLTHEVHKPIIQEVKEIIQPYRNIVQQVKPVIEDIRTIVPQDNDVNHQHQQNQPIKQFSKTTDWNPMLGSRKSGLVPPPPRPSPANRIQGRFYSKRPMFDSVKTSESQSKLQRRMHVDEGRFRDDFTRNRRRRHSRQQGKMQFGSSESKIIYVPMAPKTYSKSMQQNVDDIHAEDVNFYKGSGANNNFNNIIMDKYERMSNQEHFDRDRLAESMAVYSQVNPDYESFPAQMEGKYMADFEQPEHMEEVPYQTENDTEEDHYIPTANIAEMDDEMFGKRTMSHCHSGDPRCDDGWLSEDSHDYQHHHHYHHHHQPLF